MPQLSLRNLTDGDFDDFQHVFQGAFLMEAKERDDEWLRTIYEPERFHGVFDDGALIGTCGIASRRIVLPGNGFTPFAAVTAVSVKPGHRRRGALTTMMRAQLHSLHEQGAEPFAALWASEASIYGRFGYGLAVQHTRVSIARPAPFRPGVDFGTDRVMELPRDEAVPVLRELYDALVPGRTGWLNRTDSTWQWHLWDTEHQRSGSGPFRFAVHPGGYAVFRPKPGWNDNGPAAEIDVHEVVAASPVAYAALWRYLLDYDLVSVVRAQVPLDDPLPHMLADPRRVERRNHDSLWVRLVDVDRALAQRRYRTAVDTVLELTDAFCPWNEGRWRLTAEADGPVHVERTTAAADLAMDTRELGAAFLGGTPLTQLAAAGLVRELTPGALRSASRAFTTDRWPHCPEVF